MFNKNGGGVFGVFGKCLLIFSLIASVVLAIDNARHDDFKLHTSTETRIFDKDYSFDDLQILSEATEQISDETETAVNADVADEESVESEDIPPGIIDETEPIEGTVYWVKNGEVWHISEKCPSLSRSKSILSGTVTEAKENGKTRVCKRCGQ